MYLITKLEWFLIVSYNQNQNTGVYSSQSQQAKLTNRNS